MGREASIAFHWACAVARHRVLAGENVPHYIRILSEAAALFGQHDPHAQPAYRDGLTDNKKSMLAVFMDTYLASDAQWAARYGPTADGGIRQIREGWNAALIETHGDSPDGVSLEAQLAAIHANRSVEQAYEEGWLLLASGAWRKSAQVSFLIPAALVRYRLREETDVVFPVRPERFADLSPAEQSTARLMLDLLCTGDKDPLDALPESVDQFSSRGEALAAISMVFQKQCASLFKHQRPDTIPMGRRARHVMSTDYHTFDAAHDLVMAAMPVFD